MVGSVGCSSGDGTGELARDEADDADALLVLRDMLGDAVMDEAVDTGDKAGEAVAVLDVLPFFRRPEDGAAAAVVGCATAAGVVEAVNLSFRYDGTMRMISFDTDDDGSAAVDEGGECVAF